MSITLSALQQQRRDTAANWTAADPTLLAGELGYETDTGKWKVGDGSTAWSSLSYEQWSEVSAHPLATADIADDAITSAKLDTNIDIAGTLDVTAAATFDSNVTVEGNLTVNGTTTTIDSTTLTVEDKNIELGVVTTPTDVTANGGGITLKGTTDKTINWVDSTDAWTFSEHVNIASGKEYRIDGASVLSATTLGSGVTGSSLTSVGTILSGTWSASTIAVNKGGTGQVSYSDGQLLIGNSTGNTLDKATLTAGSGVTITNGSGSISISATGSGGTVTDVTATSPIASSGGNTPAISIQDGTTAQKGAVQLSDSTTSTSTTLAATANAVKVTKDVADAAMPKAGGTATGTFTFSSNADTNAIIVKNAGGTQNVVQIYKDASDNGSIDLDNSSGTNNIKLEGGTGDAYFAGQIGIGIASPSADLHISDANPEIRLQDTDGTNQFSRFRQMGTGTYYDARNNTGGGSHIFRTYNGSSYTERLRIASDGAATFDGTITTDEQAYAQSFIADTTAGGFAVYQGKLNGTVNCEITASGSATFASGVTADFLTTNTAYITNAVISNDATIAGDVDITGEVDCAGLDVDGTYVANVTAVSALDIDCSAGNYFTKTINANSTFTFSSVPSSGAYSFTLELTHTSGTVTWPTSVEFPDDTAPTLATGKTHLFMFVTDDGGTKFRGAALVDYDN